MSLKIIAIWCVKGREQGKGDGSIKAKIGNGKILRPQIKNFLL